jgi:uncharacterized membrane protein
LSPAVNDPTTAVQALDVLADLLRVRVRRDLGVVVVDGADRAPRIVVRLLTWEEYVSVALDEVISVGSSSGQVLDRIRRLLGGLLAIAPTQHRPAVERRLAAVTTRPASMNAEAMRGAEN